jgi:lysylphosphatidylglycerol synthetase-like protein (DUF2156 family)
MEGRVQELPKGLSVTALVLGIVGLFLSIIPWCNWVLAVPCCVLAIVFGTVAGTRAREGFYGGESLARAGLVCGTAGAAIIVIWIVVIILQTIFFARFMGYWELT